MPKLFLLRHGESEECKGLQTDFDRNLTVRGRLWISKLSNLLSDQNIFPARIICSGAARAKQTATLIASKKNGEPRKIEIVPLLYQCTHLYYMDLAHSFGHSELVLMVGHNPSITAFMNYLTGENHSLFPGSLAEIILHPPWSLVTKNSGILNKLIHPFQ